MRKIMLLILALVASLAIVGTASATGSRALFGTQKIAVKTCNQFSDCIGWRASCRGPNSKRQWKCKATDFYTNETCLIGLTWVQKGGKLYLTKYGDPVCYS